eukprot:15236136-Ditylum_brightwellii.AAC.1
MSCALGSTTVAQESIMIDLQEFSDIESVCSANSSYTMDNATIDQLLSEVTSGSIDLDEYTVSLAHISSNVGVNEKHLSKVWRINPETDGKTLNVTTKKQTCVDNPSLARKFSTNDKMLRYKRINCYIYMDTLFATNKAHKSTR